MRRRVVGASCTIGLVSSGTALVEVHGVSERLLLRLVRAIGTLLLVLVDRAQSRSIGVPPLLLRLALKVLVLGRAISSVGWVRSRLDTQLLVPCQQGLPLTGPGLLRLPLHQHLVLLVDEALELALLEIAHQYLLLL